MFLYILLKLLSCQLTFLVCVTVLDPYGVQNDAEYGRFCYNTFNVFLHVPLSELRVQHAHLAAPSPRQTASTAFKYRETNTIIIFS